MVSDLIRQPGGLGPGASAQPPLNRPTGASHGRLCSPRLSADVHTECDRPPDLNSSPGSGCSLIHPVTSGHVCVTTTFMFAERIDGVRAPRSLETHFNAHGEQLSEFHPGNLFRRDPSDHRILSS